MASEHVFVSTVESSKCCTICSEQFASEQRLKQARFLPCGHTFCLQCIQGSFDKVMLQLSCPTCNKKTGMDIAGLGKLPRNFMLENPPAAAPMLLSGVSADVAQPTAFIPCEQEKCGLTASVFCEMCLATFCEKCNKSFHGSPIMRKHVRIPIGSRPLMCPQHHTPLTLVLEQDKIPICVECLRATSKSKTKASRHVDKYMLLQSDEFKKVMFVLEKQQVQLLLLKVNFAIKVIDITLEHQEHRRSLEKMAQALEGAISLHSTRREDSLLLQLKDIMRQQMALVNACVAQIMDQKLHRTLSTEEQASLMKLISGVQSADSVLQILMPGLALATSAFQGLHTELLKSRLQILQVVLRHSCGKKSTVAGEDGLATTSPLSERMLTVLQIIQHTAQMLIDNGRLPRPDEAPTDMPRELASFKQTETAAAQASAAPLSVGTKAPATADATPASAPAAPSLAVAMRYSNAFAILQLDRSRKSHLLVVSPTSPRAVVASRPNQGWWWQTVACKVGRSGKAGMVIREGAGIGFFQVRVRIFSGSGSVVVGLMSAEASVADGQYPGSTEMGVGWQSDGLACWSMPGPAPGHGLVCFGDGDRVGLVLDCRGLPVVRLLVNGQQCMVHRLELPTPITVFPALGVCGVSDRTPHQQASAELDDAPLPDLSQL